MCQARDWQCAHCRVQTPLEPHHRVELHRGGANSIDNIEPLCHPCHRAVHEWPDDVSDAWMSFQEQLLSDFEQILSEMGQVRLSHGTKNENQARILGDLLELFPARRGELPLRGLLPKQKQPPREPFVSRGLFNQDWWDLRARARVRWVFPRNWEETVALAHLTRAQEKIEMFEPLQVPLMQLPEASATRRTRRERSFHPTQMAFDFSL